MSDGRFTQESLFTYIGDPEEENMVELEQGDIIRYSKYGKEMEACFIAAKKGSNAVKIRKCMDGYDVISLECIKEKVEDPDIQEGFVDDRDTEEVRIPVE